MTCIIAIEAIDQQSGKNVVVMAGDWQATGNYIKQNVTKSKIFSHSNLLFGYTATFRFGQLVEHCLNNNTLIPPSNASDNYKWLVVTFVPALIKTLESNRYDASLKGVGLLIGINGEVWEVQSDFSVLRNSLGFNSVGHNDIALVSMHTYALTQFSNIVRPKVDEVNQMIPIVYRAVALASTVVSESYDSIVM